MKTRNDSQPATARLPVRGYAQRRRRLAVATALLFALGIVGVAVDARRMLADPVAPRPDTLGRPQPPVFAFDVPSADEPTLERPISVAFARDRLYVSDSLIGHVMVFRPNGTLLGSIGEDRLEVPLYLAVDEERDELLVTDRVHESLLVFDATTGSFIDTITPTVEGSATAEPWNPLALDVSEDGSLFVSNIAEPHRIWHLARDGEVLGMLPRTLDEEAPAGLGTLDFPNAVKSLDGRVWVADSNNRRLVEFDAQGEQVRSLPLGGLIRGFDVLMAEEGGPVYFAFVDAFSHQVVIVSDTGSEIARIGEPGSGEGQFAFPNDVDAAAGIVWIADTGNARVQAWEWDGAARTAALRLWPGGPGLSGLLGALLLLSPLALLLNLRPVRVVVSGRTLPTLGAAAADGRVWKRVRLVVTPSAEVTLEAYPWLPRVSERKVSPSDASFVRNSYGLDAEQSDTLALALRTRALLTDDREIAAVARAGGLDVYDVHSFIDEFSTPLDAGEEDTHGSNVADRT